MGRTKETTYKLLEIANYKFQSYEYDWDAQREKARFESKGYETKLVRERSDTQGLKMYSIWVRES